MCVPYLCTYVLTNCVGCFHTTAFLCRRTPPLGPMPNEDIAVENLDSLEKYRSFNRYFRQAEEAKNKPAWWKTYKSYVEKSDPEHGEKQGRKQPWTNQMIISCGSWKRSFCRRRASGHRTALLSTPQDQRGEGEEADDEGQQEECWSGKGFSFANL